MIARRTDYAFPLRIDGGSQQVARSAYPEHVDEMLRQLLLTNPGERTCLPQFGCGLRRLVFAPQVAGLESAVKIQVQAAISQWLADQVTVDQVEVQAGSDPSTGLDPGELKLTLTYTLVDALAPRQLELVIR
jgi:phage baseplate assembly protein W